MRTSITIVTAAILTVFSSARVRAQERGDVGITMGDPAAVGVLFHVSDSLAIRPEVSFSTTTTDIPLTTSSSTLYGVGVSALIYVKRWDALGPTSFPLQLPASRRSSAGVIFYF
jgi:hypothetical protein